MRSGQSCPVPGKFRLFASRLIVLEDLAQDIPRGLSAPDRYGSQQALFSPRMIVEPWHGSRALVGQVSRNNAFLVVAASVEPIPAQADRQIAAE
jgi:hypothetical protein